MNRSAQALAWWVGLGAAASLVSFVLYGWDKSEAKRGGTRISERSLHCVALIGGWPGALLAQRVFRHKTKKVSFRRMFWLTVAINLLLSALLVGGWVASHSST